jgi:hypothetical protein
MSQRLWCANAIPIARVRQTDVLSAGMEPHTLLYLAFCIASIVAGPLQVYPRKFAGCHYDSAHNLEPKITGDVTDQALCKCKHDRTIKVCSSPGLYNVSVK